APLAETLRAGQSAPYVATNQGKKPLRLGLIIGIGRDPDAAMAKVRELGLPTSQVFADEFEMDLVGRLRQALEKRQIEATSLVVGGPGKEVWNFDLANLILYGKANPVDAIELLGPYVQGIHAKDGLFPTNSKELGKEVPIGKGKVDFPRIIERLKQLNYRGAVTIEREISGPQQVADVREAKAYLEKLIG